MEKVDFLATDGIELSGILYNGKEKNKKIILSIHGMASNCMKTRDTIIAKNANENNIDYFCFNNRGSELVKYIRRYTEGKREKELGGTSYEDVLEGYEDITGAIIKLKELGYKDTVINKMSVLFPQIYSLSEEHITEIIKYLTQNNYTQEEIFTITTSFPTIFSKYNKKKDKKAKKITRIEDTKSLFLELGFTEEMFKYIFIKCPSIISYDKNNLKNKILFFLENNEMDFVLENPNHLKQSSITSYARKFFLEAKGITISSNNFKMIFIADRDFKRKFKVSKDEVIKQYQKRLSKWEPF